ncbi:MAG: class I SAM-dependent methyltransferase [Patescibacteria group bacterium]
MGWGKITAAGVEMWDSKPVIRAERATAGDWLKLLFYPKKLLLYSYILRAYKIHKRNCPAKIFRVLDVGCGTGASVIDFKKILGAGAEVLGIEVVKLQVEIGRTRIAENKIRAEIKWYDGTIFPFINEYFDAVYSSDVLGHVENVPAWLQEINRVLRPGGIVAMFSESVLGRHAYIRNYLNRRGLNIDPHREFHISLYSKSELLELLNQAGFGIEIIRSIAWSGFFVHPDEFYPALQAQSEFPILKFFNYIFYKIKKRTHPVSTALAELFVLLEMLTLGKWFEAQGYIIRARKR